MSLRNAENSNLIHIFSCFGPSDNMTKQLKIASGGTNFKDNKAPQRQMLRTLFKSDPTIFANADDENISILYSGDDDSSARNSTASLNPNTPSHRFAVVHQHHNNNMSPTPSNETASPYLSPYTKSPWTHQQFLPPRHSLHGDANTHNNWLMGSLVREEGHVYSLATSGDLLYTGSDSKNIRVWKKLKDFAGFKSNSGLVKAIVVFGDKIFTGHQDGKIRVWKLSGGLNKNGYKRVGNLPTTRDFLKSSFNPRNYVEVRRHRNVPWIKHYDAVSCMAVDLAGGLLYSGSWDKSLKVWRLSDSKCLESIAAHEDAVNSVVIGFDGMVFTGSADGTVKAWRRELVGKQTKHVLVETMLQQESAVTSLALNGAAGIIYAGSSDGLVNFWEFDQKRFVSHGGVLRGHKLAVLCLAVAGNLVFSGSADKSICVWRRETGGVHACISVLTGHTGPVKCLAVEEDGQYESENGDDKRWTLYSGSLDKSVMVWRVSDHAPVNK